MPKMTDSELLRAVEALEEDSYGFEDGTLAEQREDALRAFLGEELVPSVEGRSSTNSSVLRDTYLWIAPQLLRTFLGSDEVVRFEPSGPEDEQAAKQETEVIQWISERSEPFVQFNSMFQDACLLGVGYAKVWWHSDESVQIERYEGKSDDELSLMMQDSEVEVIEHTARPDPEWMAMPPQIDPQTGQPIPPPPQPMLHDVVVRRKVVDEYARYEAVPPEEMRISQHTRSVSLQGCQFVEHRRKITISELREMGYDVPDDIGDWYDDGDDDTVREARDRWDEDSWEDDDEADPASRRVTYREAYALLDANKDGKAERIKVCIVGRKILHREETDIVPFAAISPVLFAHRHIGLSLWDLLKEIEALRTVITRSYLDGLYLSLNQRTAVDVNSVNIDDLLVSRPGGVVRTVGTPLDKVMPMPINPTGQQALEGLNMLDQWKQDATGVSAIFQGGPGMDSTSLNNVNVGTVSQVVSQAQMRIEAIARSFADTGIKDLFLLLHHLTLKHSRKALTVKLRNAWTVVDPRTWRKRNVVSVQVALGAGTKEMRAAQLQQLIALQMQLAPMGVVTPDKLYASFARLCNELGYKNADEFVSNPAMQPPPPPPPPDPLVQAQKIKSQTDLQVKQMDAQGKAQQAQMDTQIKQAELQSTTTIEQAKLQQSAELERQKMTLQAQTDVEVARIKAELQMQTAIQLEQLRMGVEQAKSDKEDGDEAEKAQIIGAIQSLQTTVQALAQEIARSQQPKQVVRDQRGRVVGMAGPDGQMVHQVVRDQSGRVAGIAPAGNNLQ